MGYAATMAEAGYPEQALAEYEHILKLIPDVIGKNGYGSVLRALGRLV